MQMPNKKPRKRIKVRGKYVRVRQRSTKKGRKGTIMGKWRPKKTVTRTGKRRKSKVIRKKTKSRS
jgi:hypothetical protein